MKEWINKAQNLERIAREDNLGNKKGAAEEVFGSNLQLLDKAVGLNPQKSLQTQWTALSAAIENKEKKSLSCLLVPEEGVEPSIP